MCAGSLARNASALQCTLPFNQSGHPPHTKSICLRARNLCKRLPVACTPRLFPSEFVIHWELQAIGIPMFEN